MLSPSSGRIVLLPQDRELIALLGCSEKDYIAFCRELAQASRVEPGQPTAFFIIPFLIQLAIGVALSMAATLLAPKPSTGRPAQIERRTVEGQDLVQSDRFVPMSGFGGSQNVVEIGSVIPLVFANRETIDGITYGGVRVNSNLLWSEIAAIRGGLMIRAMYMVGEGLLPTVDSTQVALGDNLLNTYQFDETVLNQYGRMSLYYSGDGGNLMPTDLIAGRAAANDEGNAVNSGGPVVFATRRTDDGDWTQDFSYAMTPTSQTAFGVYQPIGNGLIFRVNPEVRSSAIPFFSPHSDGSQTVYCNDSPTTEAKRMKQEASFNSRANVLGRDGAIVTAKVGDTINYSISTASDWNFTFTKKDSSGPDATEGSLDVATTIAGRNKQYDDSLVLGELYKLGTALFVLVDRSDNAYVSSTDTNPPGGGSAVTARLRCVRAGTYQTTGNTSKPSRTLPVRNGTNTTHLFRVARASFVTDRPCGVVEFCIRSSLGIRFNGLLDFRNTVSYRTADSMSCESREGDRIPEGGNFVSNEYYSGTFSGPEERYSFFRISFRTAGSKDPYTVLSRLYGVRSAAQVAVYNSLRFQMPAVARWEFLIEPVSGWEVRSNAQKGDLEVMDWKGRVRVANDGPVRVRYTGSQVTRSSTTFLLPQGSTAKNQVLDPDFRPIDGNNYVDAWGKLAELFVYEQVTSSANSPEHEIVYVNQVTPNETIPTYANLALFGMNLRSSQEITQLSQVSVYVNRGIKSTHLFPEILRTLLLDNRFGLGSILSGAQVDSGIFDEMNTWTYGRRYFWDGALTSKVNALQWASEMARRFLLDFSFRNGIYTLKPAVYFDRPEPITGMYSSGNIVDDTFTFSYLEPGERQPPRLSVRWREEAVSNSNNSGGLFPQVREVTVREVDYEGFREPLPFESLDVTAFCTSEQHAIDIAKFECRFRRLVTHGVTFKVMPCDALGLDLAHCFKLSVSAVAYSQSFNGVIDSSGQVRGWDGDLLDGDYPVMLWAGSGSEITVTTLQVRNNRAPDHPNSLFSLRSTVSEVVETYKVQALSFDEDGLVEVRAIHWPVDAGGYSLISKGWETGWDVVR